MARTRAREGSGLLEQIAQRRETRIDVLFIAVATAGIEIGAALRADAAAVRPAQRPLRRVQDEKLPHKLA